MRVAWVHVEKVRCNIRAVVRVVGKMLVRHFDGICAVQSSVRRHGRSMYLPLLCGQRVIGWISRQSGWGPSFAACCRAMCRRPARRQCAPARLGQLLGGQDDKGLSSWTRKGSGWVEGCTFDIARQSGHVVVIVPSAELTQRAAAGQGCGPSQSMHAEVVPGVGARWEWCSCDDATVGGGGAESRRHVSGW